MPTIGIDYEKIEINEASIMVWVIGGRLGSRALWQQYYDRMSALIFVVDSHDRDRVDQACEQLHLMANKDKLREKPILIFANKQDLPDAMTLDELRDKLHLAKLNTNTKLRLQPASAIQNQGLREGFEWLANCIVEKIDPIKPIVETFNDTITMKNDFMSIFNMVNLKTFLRKLI
ncbi:unnamed protein product [Rotaria sordida]|uniref:ADP-ribosylation factor n=1 Tax=Rotaria sordida TaxID=392033 RepID=A0A815B332_9BILA|nr:unnamed protein product [Rotaria sordida]CAF1542151.1 unnamed protein product [Rotaria sordida]